MILIPKMTIDTLGAAIHLGKCYAANSGRDVRHARLGPDAAVMFKEWIEEEDRRGHLKVNNDLDKTQPPTFMGVWLFKMSGPGIAVIYT